MVFLFILSWLVLFVYAVRLMSMGWRINQKDIDLEYKVEKRTVTKTVHPEMEEVEVGDELLVVGLMNLKERWILDLNWIHQSFIILEIHCIDHYKIELMN